MMKSAKRKFRTLIADQHLLFRRGLRTLLSEEADFEVTGDVSTVHEAVSCVATTRAELVLLDSLLVQDNPEGQAAMRELETLCCVCFLASETDQNGNQSTLDASKTLLKSTSSADLIAGIRLLAQTFVAGDEGEAQRTAADLNALAQLNQRYGKPNDLTSREQEVLRLLAECHTVKETANELCLSVKTAEAHKLNLMRKLDIHNRTALVEYALRNGVITVPTHRSAELSHRS